MGFDPTLATARALKIRDAVMQPTINSAQFKGRNRRDRFIRACQPVSITSLNLVQVPELLRGTVFDPRIDFPPIVIESVGVSRSTTARKPIASIKKFLSAPGRPMD
jgi:hypothetical protein